MKYNPQIHHRRSVRLKGYDYSQAGAYFITICTQDRECMFGKIVVGANPGVRPENPDVRAEMILNDSGIMINKWWQKIPEKFPDIELDVYQIMPNHFHAIVINNGTGNVVGANPRVRPDQHNRPDNKSHVRPDDKTRIHPDDKTRIHPDSRDNPKNEMDVNPKNETTEKGQTRHTGQKRHTGQTRGSAPTTTTNANDSTLGEHVGLGEHLGSPLHRVVQWFKTMSTNEYICGVKSLGWPPFNGKLWQRNYHEHIIRNDQSYQTISYYIITNPAKWNEDKFFKD